MNTALVVVLGLVVAGGVAGVVLYETYKAPATPAAQATGFMSGQTRTLTANVGATITLSLPPAPPGATTGSTWVSLTDPNGNPITVSGSGPVTTNAAQGTYTATWTFNGATQTGSITVTVNAPPSGA